MPKSAQIRQWQCWGWNPERSRPRVQSLNHHSLYCLTPLRHSSQTAGSWIWSPGFALLLPLLNLLFPLDAIASLLILAHVDYCHGRQCPASWRYFQHILCHTPGGLEICILVSHCPASHRSVPPYPPGSDGSESSVYISFTRAVRGRIPGTSPEFRIL